MLGVLVTNILKAIAVLALCYVAIAFAEFAIHPYHWHFASRLVLGILSVISLILVFTHLPSKE